MAMFLYRCFCKVFSFVVMLLLWWCFLYWCFCDGVFVVFWLWLCFCGDVFVVACFWVVFCCVFLCSVVFCCCFLWWCFL